MKLASGKKNKITWRRANRGTWPSAPHDQTIVGGFPSAAAKFSASGGRILLICDLAAVLVPHQPVDQAERQNSAREPEDRERLEANEVDDDKFPRHGKQSYENHSPQLHNTFLAVQDAHYRVIESNAISTVMIMPKTDWKLAASTGAKGLNKKPQHLRQNQMRSSDDNDAADQEGQDECHRLLKALVNSEAGPGVRCLLKQTQAKSATCFAFRVVLSAHDH